MNTTVMAGVIQIVPWLFGLAGAGLLVYLGVRVGLPALRIAALHEELKARDARLETAMAQLATATEHAKAAELREQQCVARLEAATKALEEADRKIRTLVDALHIAGRLDELAQVLQPRPKEAQVAEVPG